MESVILNSPIILIGYGLALFFCIFDIVKRSSGYVFPLISVFICLGTTIYALICGATMYEVGSVIILFLVLNLSAFKGNKRDKK